MRFEISLISVALKYRNGTAQPLENLGPCAAEELRRRAPHKRAPGAGPGHDACTLDRSTTGRPAAAAKIEGLTFHDLRRSAVVRLALGDATVPQIATFTGHSLRDVEAILDAHYLGRDVKLAEIAVMKLETRTKV